MGNNESVSKKKRMIPSFEFSLCMSCSICVQACPFSCLELAAIGSTAGARTGAAAGSTGDADKVSSAAVRYGKRFPFLQQQDFCTGCGICMQACPMDCITMVERS